MTHPSVADIFIFACKAALPSSNKRTHLFRLETALPPPGEWVNHYSTLLRKSENVIQWEQMMSFLRFYSDWSKDKHTIQADLTWCYVSLPSGAIKTGVVEGTFLSPSRKSQPEDKTNTRKSRTERTGP